MEPDFSVERLRRLGGPGGYREALIIGTADRKEYVLHEMFLVYEENQEVVQRACQTGTLQDLVIAVYNRWQLVEHHTKKVFDTQDEQLQEFRKWSLLLRKGWDKTTETCGYPIPKKIFYQASS